MRVITVRHGRTAWNANRILQGQSDIPLSNEGKIQAILLRQEFINRHYDFDVCYCSPMMRAAETAQIGLGFLNPNKNIWQRDINASSVMSKNADTKFRCSIIYDKRIRERNLGKADGAPESALKNPELTWDLIKNVSVADMETVQHLLVRVSNFYHEIIAKAELEYGKEATVLIVAHGGVLRMLNYVILGGKLPPEGPLSVLQKEQFFDTYAYKESINFRTNNCEIHEYEI